MKQKGFLSNIIGILVLLVIVGYGAYYLGTQNSQSTAKNNDLNNPTSTKNSSIPSTVMPSYNVQALSPDGKKKVYIKNIKENNQLVQSLFIADVNGLNEIELLNNIDTSKTLGGLTSTNWSLNGTYIYLLIKDSDKDNVYVFKSTGGSFQNGKKYLFSSDIGFNLQLQPGQIPYWQTNTQIVLMPKIGFGSYAYIFDVEKATVSKVRAGS